MSNNGRKSGEFVIKQEEDATDIDACVGHGKLVELSYQNEYLKSPMVGLSNLHLPSDGHSHLKESEVKGNGALGPVEELQGKIESLSRELLLEKKTRNAAEEALKHLQEVYSKADAKVQEITAKLAEAQLKMDQEIKVRDEKNTEPDLKLSMLHERAKQRTLEVQKDQSAQRENESGISKYKKQAQVIPWRSSSSSSSSSSSDFSSDESETELRISRMAMQNTVLESMNMDNCILSTMVAVHAAMQLLASMPARRTGQASTPRQLKRKRAPADGNRKKSPARLVKDLQAPTNGSGKK